MSTHEQSLEYQPNLTSVTQHLRRSQRLLDRTQKSKPPAIDAKLSKHKATGPRQSRSKLRPAKQHRLNKEKVVVEPDTEVSEKAEYPLKDFEKYSSQAARVDHDIQGLERGTMTTDSVSAAQNAGQFYQVPVSPFDQDPLDSNTMDLDELIKDTLEHFSTGQHQHLVP